MTRRNPCSTASSSGWSSPTAATGCRCSCSSPGTSLTDELAARLKDAIRRQASPRHVPDEVLEVPAIPHTTTGKKLEVPIKRIFQGVPVEKACNLGAVDDPSAVTWFAELAGRRR